MHRTLAVALALTLASMTAACGSDEAATDDPTTVVSSDAVSNDAASNDAAVVEDEPSEDEVVEEEGAEITEPTVVSPPAEETEPPATVDDSADEPADAEVAEFCLRVEAADEATAAFDAVDDPVAYEAFLTEGQVLYESALDAAPAAIEPDMAILIDYIVEVIASGDDLGWDEDAMNDFADDLSTPELLAAIDSFDDYTDKNCSS